MARLLWDASEGCPEDIPDEYCGHLSHEYLDGSISLGSLLNKLEDYSEMEDKEVEEAIEILGKVHPNDWPNVEDIEGFSCEELLKVYEEDAHDGFNFVEDNLDTSDKVEKVLAEAISSVFGSGVSNIRSEKGLFPNPKNNFLQQEDGTFAGVFEYDGKKFLFEIFPDESGWTTTYRMQSDDLAKLPPIPAADNQKKNNYTRHVRHRGWS